MTTPESFSSERLRELHEAEQRARDPVSSRHSDEHRALAVYLLQHLPAILALADRLQEAEKDFRDYAQHTVDCEVRNPDERKCDCGLGDAFTRHASRTRDKRDT